MRAQLLRGSGVARLSEPTFHQLQCIEPKSVDLDGLSTPRGDDPIADLRIHPRELKALLALPQQSISEVDPNPKFSPAEMVSHDIPQHRQEARQRFSVLRHMHVAVN